MSKSVSLDTDGADMERNTEDQRGADDRTSRTPE